jgi:hypothetical protein
MVLFVSLQWMAAVAVFPQINNALGEGKLHLRVGTTKGFIWRVGERLYLGCRSSRSESLSILNRIVTKDVLCFSKSQHGVKVFLN